MNWATCAWAAEFWNLEVLKWARAHHCPWNNQVFLLAANQEVTEWALANGCPTTPPV